MSKWNPWSDARTRQYNDLVNDYKCPDNGRLGSHRPNSQHGLQAVTFRSWRNLFRKKYYWRCRFCNLRVEVKE